MYYRLSASAKNVILVHPYYMRVSLSLLDGEQVSQKLGKANNLWVSAREDKAMLHRYDIGCLQYM